MDDHNDTRMLACNGKYIVDNDRCSEETSHFHRNLKEFIGRLRATSAQAAIGDVLEECPEVLSPQLRSSALAAKS